MNITILSLQLFLLRLITPSLLTMYATIYNPERTQKVKVRVSVWDDTANKYRKDIFPEN